jgi:anti-sigma factor RsiW
VMTCEEAGVLLHALLDSELDASHAYQVEEHLATCPDCSARLRQFGELRRAIASLAPQYQMRAGLRQRIEAALALGPSRRNLLKGFAMATVLSSAAAAGARPLRADGL